MCEQDIDYRAQSWKHIKIFKLIFRDKNDSKFNIFQTSGRKISNLLSLKLAHQGLSNNVKIVSKFPYKF
jgi:hypothetical protein